MDLMQYLLLFFYLLESDENSYYNSLMGATY